MRERFLNFICRQKQVPIPDIDQENRRLGELTLMYLTEKISLETYNTETEKLSKLNLRALAAEVDWRPQQVRHATSIQEFESANLELGRLTAQYMRGEIELPEYRREIDKLPTALDLRKNFRRLSRRSGN